MGSLPFGRYAVIGFLRVCYPTYNNAQTFDTLLRLSVLSTLGCGPVIPVNTVVFVVCRTTVMGCLVGGTVHSCFIGS